MAKSKRNNSVSLHGYLDVKNGKIVETIEKKDEVVEEFVYSFEEIIKQFDGKKIALSIRETTELESV